MTRAFVFRTWSRDQLGRLKELWRDGKSADECCGILRASSPGAVREKAKREGFKRDPALQGRKPIELPPQARGDGSPVTIENCATRECRWPYGLPAMDMVLCGRPVEKAPWCKEHRAAAYGRKVIP